jgi:hypothetical protein
MPRPAAFAIALVLALAALPVGWSAANAQDGTPAATAGHPVVGAWTADNDIDDPENPPALLIFHDDGTFAQANADGSDGFGTWVATGPSTAAVTFLFHELDDSGAFAGTLKINVAVEVSQAGDDLAGEFTAVFVGPDGTTSDAFSGAAAAERIAVEPMGTPTP